MIVSYLLCNARAAIFQCRIFKLYIFPHMNWTSQKYSNIHFSGYEYLCAFQRAANTTKIHLCAPYCAIISIYISFETIANEHHQTAQCKRNAAPASTAQNINVKAWRFCRLTRRALARHPLYTYTLRIICSFVCCLWRAQYILLCVLERSRVCFSIHRPRKQVYAAHREIYTHISEFVSRKEQRRRRDRHPWEF